MILQQKIPLQANSVNDCPDCDAHPHSFFCPLSLDKTIP